jgi:hypothetical protein
VLRAFTSLARSEPAPQRLKLLWLRPALRAFTSLRDVSLRRNG